MKKIIFKILTVCLVFLLTFACFSGKNVIHLVEAEDNVNQRFEAIEMIEDELNARGTSIAEELEDQITYYQQLLDEAETERSYNNLTKLINTTYQLLAEYQAFKIDMDQNSSSEILATNNLTVTAAIAYFNSNEYVLSAELLTHASENQNIYSTYIPEHGYLIRQSLQYNTMVSQSGEYGTVTFSTTNTTIQADLHYALNAVEYRKTQSNSFIVVFDIYDFAYNSAPQGLVDWVVNLIYEAQEEGEIVPYYVEIQQSTGEETTTQTVNWDIDSVVEKRYYEDVAILVGQNFKDYYVTFQDAGVKLIQTFGPLDTYMFIFNGSGQLLVIDDDSGYGDNAAYWLTANADETYRIRIRCAYSSDRGATRLAITPAERVRGSGVDNCTKYEDIFAITNSTNMTFTSYAQRLVTAAITFTPPTAGVYKVEVESVFEPYFYIIDPTTNRPLNTGTGDMGNTESMYASLSTITSKLKVGIPYLIVYSQLDIGGYFINYDEGDDLIIRMYKV